MNLIHSCRLQGYNDEHAYGSLFQWGRYSDGHELITYSGPGSGSAVNGSTAVNSTTDTPGHNLFIQESNSPYDWIEPQNDDLWQGESGTNNPCPIGYRLPTQTEWVTFKSSEGISNRIHAANSSLRIPATGYRWITGGFAGLGNSGRQWSSTVNGTQVYTHYFYCCGTGSVNSYRRAAGLAVRCIKD